MIVFKLYPGAGSFLDPQSIKDENGNDVPYGPYRYNQIVREQYFITKELNTSFVDLEKITPTDRELLINFINDDNKKAEEKMKALRKANNK